jgi:hypothetical protein
LRKSTKQVELRYEIREFHQAADTGRCMDFLRVGSGVPAWEEGGGQAGGISKQANYPEFDEA